MQPAPPLRTRGTEFADLDSGINPPGLGKILRERQWNAAAGARHKIGPDGRIREAELGPTAGVRGADGGLGTGASTTTMVGNQEAQMVVPDSNTIGDQLFYKNEEQMKQRLGSKRKLLVLETVSQEEQELEYIPGSSGAQRFKMAEDGGTASERGMALPDVVKSGEESAIRELE
jgi:hypothetical protein